MNEIESEVAGVAREVLVETPSPSSSPLLFRVDPQPEAPQDKRRSTSRPPLPRCPAATRRPAAQGGSARTIRVKRRAGAARLVAAQAGGAEVAGRTDHDSSPGEGVRRAQGSGLRRLVCRGGAVRTTYTSSAVRWPFAFRAIPYEVKTIRDLNLPQVLEESAPAAAGLCLVTGVTGSGKSTGARAMINHINTNRRVNIITSRPDRSSCTATPRQHLPARGRERHPLLQRGVAPRPAARRPT